MLDTNKILKGHGFVILASTQLELSTCLMFVFQKFLMNPDSLVTKLPYVCGMLEYRKRILKCTHEWYTLYSDTQCILCIYSFQVCVPKVYILFSFYVSSTNSVEIFVLLYITTKRVHVHQVISLNFLSEFIGHSEQDPARMQ